MDKNEENPWLKIFTPVRFPDNNNPWLELQCDKDEQLFLKDFVVMLNNLPRLNALKQPFLFRGQSDKSWTLKPKFFRLWDTLIERGGQDLLKDALLEERDSIRYFQQRTSAFPGASVNLGYDLNWRNLPNWLAIMQHYSAPTRFLDWTGSFYVALYFATIDDQTDGAIWFFLSDGLHSYIKDHPELMPDVTKKDEITFDDLLELESKQNRIINVYDDDFKTERTVSQLGLFTFSYHLATDHATILGKILYERRTTPLTKIIIPAKMKQEIRYNLAKINITNETLFPGMDGVGRAITEKIKLYQEKILRSKLKHLSPESN